MNKEKLITAAVVFLGVGVLVAAKRFGADPDWLVAGGGVLAIVAGTLRSMLLPENKT